MLHCCGYNKGIHLKLNVVFAVIKIIKYIGCFGIDLISNIHVAAHGSYITDRGGIKEHIVQDLLIKLNYNL